MVTTEQIEMMKLMGAEVVRPKGRDGLLVLCAVRMPVGFADRTDIAFTSWCDTEQEAWEIAWSQLNRST